MGNQQLQQSSWAEQLKLSQSKYLTEVTPPAADAPCDWPNLTISNKLKGILAMHSADNELKVVENVWKRQVSQF